MNKSQDAYVSNIISLILTRVAWQSMVKVLDDQWRGSGFRSRPGQKFVSKFLLHMSLIANSATMMNMLTVHCQWDDEMGRERTGYQHTYAEAKNMKSLALHTCGCPRASLSDCSSLYP